MSGGGGPGASPETSVNANAGMRTNGSMGEALG